MKRRDFLQQTALASAGVLATNQLLAEPQYNRIEEYGVQLYTVRDPLQKDFAGTVKALKKIGYDYCEAFDFAGGKMLGKSVKEAKSIFEKNRLKVKSIHVVTGAQMPQVSGTLVNDWERAVDDAAEMGAEYLVCAYLFDFERKTLDQYKKHAELFNAAGEACRKAGIQFCYHNHEFEFMEIDGQVPYDILLNQTDEYYVKMELDLYWVRYADLDPLTLFRENPKRFPLWHVKDMEKADTRVMTEVGVGRIDWRQLFTHKGDAGMQHFFVEQDRNWAVDPVASTETSYKFLKKLRF